MLVIPNGNCALWREIGCSIWANSGNVCQPLLRDNALHIRIEFGRHLSSRACMAIHLSLPCAKGYAGPQVLKLGFRLSQGLLDLTGNRRPKLRAYTYLKLNRAFTCAVTTTL